MRRYVLMIFVLIPVFAGAPQGLSAARPVSDSAKRLAESKGLESLLIRYRKISRYSRYKYAPARCYKERIRNLAELAREAKSAIDSTLLDDADWIDYYLFRARLLSDLSEARNEKSYAEKICALIPFEKELNDISDVLYSAQDERCRKWFAGAKALTERIADSIGPVKAAGGNMTGNCCGRIKAAAKKYDSWCELNSGTVPGFEDRFGKDNARIKDALAKFLKSVDNEIQKNKKRRGKRKGKPTPGSPVGAEAFRRRLVIRHLEFGRLDDYYSYGKKRFRETRAEMERLARGMDPKKTYLQIIDEMKSNHPKMGEVAPSYRMLLGSLEKFFRDKPLLSVPDYAFREIRTQRFAANSGMTPFAFFHGDRSGGVMKVAAPSRKMSASDIEAKLRSQNYYFMFTVVPHETIPGHHLQLSLASRLTYPRVPAHTPFFVEGWAFYCEELMDASGFYERKYQPEGWNLDPKLIRLYRLKWQLHRAARVIIDIGYHTRGMKFDDAVNLLVDEVGLHPNDARAEVMRFTRSPTQPMSYMIGKRAIVEMRDGYKKKMGRDFTLKDFHDRLLGYGSIPPLLIRAVMLGERDEAAGRMERALAKHEPK